MHLDALRSKDSAIWCSYSYSINLRIQQKQFVHYLFNYDKTKHNCDSLRIEYTVQCY